MSTLAIIITGILGLGAIALLTFHAMAAIEDEMNNDDPQDWPL